MIGCSTSPVVVHLALNVNLTPCGFFLVPALFGDTVASAVNVVGESCAMVGATSTAARARTAAAGIRTLRIDALLVGSAMPGTVTAPVVGCKQKCLQYQRGRVHE